MARLFRFSLLLTASALALGACGATLLAQASGDLFPDIKVVSADELDKMIADYDKKNDLPPTVLPKAPSFMAQPSASKAAAVTVSATSALAVASAASAVAASAAPPGSDTNAVSARAEYLAKLEAQAACSEAYLVKGKSVRAAVRADKDHDSEAFNQFYLRYYGPQVFNNKLYCPSVLWYAHGLQFCLALDRHAYFLADDGLDRIKKVVKVKDLSPDVKTAAEALLKRLDVDRKAALLCGADDFCLIRRLDPANRLYRLLLLQYPGDAETKTSYDHYLSVLAQKRPEKIPHGAGE